MSPVWRRTAGFPSNPGTLATRFPGVYAVGDVTSVGIPQAGVFAERQASVVADHLIARVRKASAPPGYDGTGTCYMEFGGSVVARVDVDFFSTPGHPTGTFVPPSVQTAAEKAEYGASRGGALVRRLSLHPRDLHRLRIVRTQPRATD